MSIVLTDQTRDHFLNDMRHSAELPRTLTKRQIHRSTTIPHKVDQHTVYLYVY